MKIPMFRRSNTFRHHKSNTMTQRLGLAVLTMLACSNITWTASCAPAQEPVEREIWRNASFSADGQRVLQMALVYKSTAPDAPYFNDPGAQNVAMRFRDSDVDLRTDLHNFELSDPVDSADFAPLVKPLWWKAADKLALFSGHDDLRVQRLDDGKLTALRIPQSELPGLFDGRESSADGLVLDYVPSPDEKWIAVFYRLVIQDENNPLILHFYDAIAFFSFDLDATFLGALSLTPWQGEQEVLRLDPPLPVVEIPDPAPGEAPPINTRRILVHAHYMLWSDDSMSLLVVDHANEAGQSNRAAQISGFPPSLQLLAQDAQIPAAAVATRGGGIREDGLALYADEPEDDANAGGLITGQIENWPGFAGRGQYALSELDYGL